MRRNARATRNEQSQSARHTVSYVTRRTACHLVCDRIPALERRSIGSCSSRSSMRRLISSMGRCSASVVIHGKMEDERTCVTTAAKYTIRIGLVHTRTSASDSRTLPCVPLNQQHAYPTLQDPDKGTNNSEGPWLDQAGQS